MNAISLQNARDLLKMKGLFVEEIHEATMNDRHIKNTFAVAPSPPSPNQASEANPSTLRQSSGQAPFRAGSASEAIYYPLLDTLRLYAGWLLAWYSVVFAIGIYQQRGVFPFHSELIAGLASSPVVLATSFGIFLFLMLSSFHKTLSGGLLKGLFLILLGFVAEIWFVVNI